MRGVRKAVLVAAVLVAARCPAETAVQHTARYTDAKLGLTVAAGMADLPVEGYWTVLEPAADAAVRQVCMTLSEQAEAGRAGQRSRRAEQLNRDEKARSPLWSYYYACQTYAQKHGNVGPESWEQLTSASNTAAGGNFFRNTERNAAISNFFLIPSVKLDRPPAQPRQPLIVQLAPLLDDGKAWTAFSDGSVERAPIDKALCAKYGIVITPQAGPEPAAPPQDATLAAYRILALVKPGAATDKPVLLTVVNPTTGEKATCAWDLRSAEAGTAALVKDWAGVRSRSWAAMARNGDATILEYWLSRCEPLYGCSVGSPDVVGRRGPVERTDAFGVLGGRAAVRETLQMQAIGRRGAAATNGSAVAVTNLPAVDVKSHPFEDMLKGVSPQSLPMADTVPADRAFMYVAKPAALLAFLDKGSDFVFAGGSVALKSGVAYDLKQKYLERLGFPESWMRDLLIKSGAIQDVAIMFPDLFLVDGTEATVLARVAAPKLLRPALALLGLTSLGGEIVERPVAGGATAYWVMDGDLLIVSTSREEVQRVLDLRRAGGKGSLGRSAEFRYMLAQLPVERDTRLYAYLSDPFIRRIVSAEVKIAQLRRLTARAEMESLTAAAMLYRLDGQPGQPELKTLVEMGYAPAWAAERDFRLGPDEQAVSPQYRTPSRMASLLRCPVAAATPEEAAAYKAYVENYARFWRQYFDPIAFRLDDTSAGGLSLTTYILPLVDNTIYNALKGYLQHSETRTPLRVPDLKPEPVMLLSLNLADEAWVSVARGFLAEMGSRYLSLDPKVFDSLGPSAHLAIQDADPVVTFGSGDVLGAFGAPMLSGGGHGEMLAIPILASVLTRPAQIIVELQQPDFVLKALRSAASTAQGPEHGWGPVATLTRVAGRDAWICSISIEDMVHIRFGVEVQGGYLILSNIPWSRKSQVSGARDAALNGAALDVRPEQGVLQLPSLHAAAAERDRASAIQGIGQLYPFLVCGTPSPAGAAAAMRRLFGFAPEHPGRGEWVWENGGLRSSEYGAVNRYVQPEYRLADRAFGLFQGIKNVRLNLQFEDAGLRVQSSWELDDGAGR